MQITTRTVEERNMVKEWIDFAALEAEVTQLLEQNPIMVLATAVDGHVTARSMSVVHQGLVVYLQTGNDSEKYLQLTANPQVALCAGNLQLEGLARDIGLPLAEENRFFADLYAQRHPGSFRTYSKLSFNRVIAVTAQRVVLWKYAPLGKPHRDFLDLVERRAWREMYPLEEEGSNNGMD